jgi:hypothetical protein
VEKLDAFASRYLKIGDLRARLGFDGFLRDELKF